MLHGTTLCVLFDGPNLKMTVLLTINFVVAEHHIQQHFSHVNMLLWNCGTFTWTEMDDNCEPCHKLWQSCCYKCMGKLQFHLPFDNTLLLSLCPWHFYLAYGSTDRTLGWRSNLQLFDLPLNHCSGTNIRKMQSDRLQIVI